MQTRRMLIVSLFCLVIVSCVGQQVVATAIPTNNFTSTVPTSKRPTATITPLSTTKPEITATFVLMPDGLIMLGPNHYKFLNWPLSFSLPDSWDINNRIYLSSAEIGRDAYTFFQTDIQDFTARQGSPTISVFLETIPENSEIKTYSEHLQIKWHVPDTVIEKTFTPKEVGLNLDTAIVFKTKDKTENVEYTQYEIHAIHKTTGIGIIMNSNTEIFADAESDFLDFLKKLSFD